MARQMRKRDKLCRILEARGFKEETGSSRYAKFKDISRSEEGYYFVGRNGALRYGRCISRSSSMDADAFIERYSHML